MSKVFVSDINLSNIADAIRAKNGAQTQYYPREMAAAITALTIEERHVPVQVNIQQSQNQTIKVKVKQKELKTTTISTDIRIPETFQLEATVTADGGYIPGTLNHSLVDAEWGDTIIFNATAATRLNPTITYNVLSVQPVSVGNVNVKYIFTGPSAATTYNLTDNRTISVPVLGNNETYNETVTFYVTEADILEGSFDVSITNSVSGITTSITLETEDPISQLTVTRNGSSNNSVVITNTGNLTLYDISVDCTNDGENITYQSIAPGENQVITLDDLTYTFETVSIEATSPDPDNPDYTLEQTIYFDPTLLNLNNYSSQNNITSQQQRLGLPYTIKADLTNRTINSSALSAFMNYHDLVSFENVETTWDTSNVTNMQQMFKQCQSLTSLDLSNWDTSNVTDMRQMFNKCQSLISLDLSNWDTSNVTDMSEMFKECDSLTSLDLSNWDTSAITSGGQTNNMFNNCHDLQYLIIGSSSFKFQLQSSVGLSDNDDCKILVPQSLITTYQTATGWNHYSDQFEAIENYVITHNNGQVTVTPNS